MVSLVLQFVTTIGRATCIFHSYVKIKQKFCEKNCEYFSYHLFYVLKTAVSLRRFFSVHIYSTNNTCYSSLFD